MAFDIDFQRFFSSFFVLMIRKLLNCVLCDPQGIIHFAVNILHVIFMKVKIYDFITAQCTKTSEIMLSIDGHDCSIRKRFSDIDL